MTTQTDLESAASDAIAAFRRLQQDWGKRNLTESVQHLADEMDYLEMVLKEIEQ